MQRYYNEVSYGNLNLKGTVSKWYQSSKTMKYYGEDSRIFDTDDKNTNIYELTREAVRLANNDIDFSQYDKNGDHVVDHVIIVHAGQDQAASDNPDDIWSHKWSIPGDGEQVDGIKVRQYTMLAEGSPMGTFAHEFGHDLGLPDLYDTDQSSEGVGEWDLMGSGNWLGDVNTPGNTPGHLSAWCKYFLGWVNPIKVTSPMLGEQIVNIETNSRAYMLSANPNTGYGEYFLVENRKKTGFDTFLPGEGLLIWHIDESEAGNTDKNHKLVDLEEADGQNHLDYNINRGDAEDCWVNSANGFTGNSNPNSNLYDWKQSDVGVKNISPAGSTMNADLIVNSLNPVYPVASFDSDFTDGYAPLSIAFTDTSTGSPTSRYWDFGDGTYSTEQNPKHTYYEEGIYTVSLTATNGEGSDSVAKSDYIAVANAPQPPVAGFSAGITSGYVPLSVAFTDLSTCCEIT